MGLTKRIFIERDPAYEEIRRRYAKDIEEHFKKFSFRIGTRRRNRKVTGRYWDSTWRIALQRAVKQLTLDVVWINDGVFLRTGDDLEALRGLAEKIHKDIQT